jgi:predicted helicase
LAGRAKQARWQAREAEAASTSPAPSDSDEIASFLRKRGPRVVFSTYQSSPQIADALIGRVPGFDLAIADEAHRCAGRTQGHTDRTRQSSEQG